MAKIIDPIKVELEGIESVQEALANLVAAFGPVSNTDISLLDSQRSNSEKTNVEILKYLCFEANPARDVVSVGDGSDELNAVCKAFVEATMRETQNVLRRKAKREAKGKVGLKGNEGNVINNLALRAAMNEYQKIVQTRIQEQVDADGSALAALSPGYAEKKQQQFGFTTPILVASGQLINALGTTGRANIKFSRSR